MATLIKTIKCDLAKQARNQGQQDNVITLLQQFNQESLNKLDAINFDTCKPSVMPTVINGKRAFKITVERENCKYHFNVYVDQKILEYVYQLIVSLTRSSEREKRITRLTRGKISVLPCLKWKWRTSKELSLKRTS